jgi:hypothetical protein
MACVFLVSQENARDSSGVTAAGKKGCQSMDKPLPMRLLRRPKAEECWLNVYIVVEDTQRHKDRG